MAIMSKVASLVALTSLRGVSALQLSNNAVEQPVESADSEERYAQCTLTEDMRREQGSFTSSQIFASTNTAACDAFEVAGGLEYMTMQKGRMEKKGDKLTVWVSGYPRSGSSSILSMVSATRDDNTDGGTVFSLFEPCHEGDQYKEWKQKDGCSGVLWGLARCNFEGITNLWGWADPHSTNLHRKYNKKAATSKCGEADVIAFKTVDFGHDLKEWTWLLDSVPSMKVLDVVRDPRGIYASWKGLEPFKSLVESGNFYTIPEVCENFARNLDFEDDRVHRVVFEELMGNPFNSTVNTYSFLGLEYGGKQKDWVKSVFQAKDCPEPKVNMQGFTDCHTQPGTEVAEKWRTELTDEEKKLFSENADCLKVAQAYGWPLE